MRYQLLRLSARAMQGMAASLVELDRQLERHGFVGPGSSYEYAVERRRFKEALARLRASLRQEDNDAR
jgi:hypothetical protein